MNIRWSLTVAAFAFTAAVSASAQGTTSVGSVCKDATTDATVGRGACARHGGVDKAATTKAQKAADKAAKSQAKAAKAASTSAATVTCKDGSTSQAGRGACAHHGGMAPAGTKTATPSVTPAATPSSSAPAQVASPPSTSKTGKTGNGSTNKTDPTGAIAQCKDGTYSHAKQRTGACGHHGGVAKWM